MLDRLLYLVAILTSSIALIVIMIVYFQSINLQPLYSFNVDLSTSMISEVLRDVEFQRSLLNTFIVALFQVIIALTLGVILATLIHRFRVSYIDRLEPLIVIPMFIAPIIWGFAWNYAYGPSGFIPLFSNFDPVKVGIICGLVHVPHAYALIASGLLAMDPSLEEVSRVHGASPIRTLVKVTLPMIRPSIVLAATLLFILGLEQFGIPLILLSPYGYEVLTTYLYSIPGTYILNPYPRMAVVASILLSITISITVLQRYLILREARRFITIGERYRGYYKIDVPLYVKLPFIIVLVVFIIGVVIIPLLALILRSINPLYGSTVYTFTMDYYRIILESPNHRTVLVNTLLVALIAATLGLVIYFSYAWSIVKFRRGTISVYIDLMSSMPRALPGLVAGLAFLWFYLLTPLRPLMYTYLGLALAYVILWSTLGVRFVTSSLLQVSEELENVARIHGASRAKSIILIYIPLLKRSFVITWLYLFILSIREYSIPVYLATGDTQVIGSTLVLLIGSGELGVIAALSTITVLTSLILTILMLRLGWKPY